MWLTERLTPDHKTIADFRKDNVIFWAPASRQISSATPQDELLNG